MLLHDFSWGAKRPNFWNVVFCFEFWMKEKSKNSVLLSIIIVQTLFFILFIMFSFTQVPPGFHFTSDSYKSRTFFPPCCNGALTMVSQLAIQYHCKQHQSWISAFGLGTMIYNGLECGAFFEIPFTSPCYQILRGINPVLQMIFTFMQMYFIFMNSRVSSMICALVLWIHITLII